MPFNAAANVLGSGLGAYTQYLRWMLQQKLHEQSEAKAQERWLAQQAYLTDRDRQMRREEREQHLADPLVQAQRSAAVREADPQYQSARQRMATYWPRFTRQQIASNPALMQQFQRDNELLGGVVPMEQIAQTVTSTPAITGTGPGLAQAGLPQTVRTGEQLTVPVLPEAPTKRVVFVNQQGQVVQDVQLPEGTEIRTLTPPTPRDPARFVITDHKGNVVRTLEAPPGTQIRTLPAPSSGPSGVIGAPLPDTGAFVVKPIKDKQGSVVAYTIDGKRYSVSQAQTFAERLLVNGDPRGRALAQALDVPTALPFAAKVQQAEEDLAEAQASGDPMAADKARVKLAYWQQQQDKRLGRTRPKYGLPATARTEEQRPASGPQGRDLLPPASSVEVGTEAVVNGTGKRYRSNGQSWVEVDYRVP